MLLVATSLVSFARFDAEYNHHEHDKQHDALSANFQQAPADLLSENYEEGLEEEIDGEDDFETSCYCKNAVRWFEFTQTDFRKNFIAHFASKRCVLLSVFRL
jgi:hypothetical protein